MCAGLSGSASALDDLLTVCVMRVQRERFCLLCRRRAEILPRQPPAYSHLFTERNVEEFILIVFVQRHTVN